MPDFREPPLFSDNLTSPKLMFWEEGRELEPETSPTFPMCPCQGVFLDIKTIMLLPYQYYPSGHRSGIAILIQTFSGNCLVKNHARCLLKKKLWGIVWPLGPWYCHHIRDSSSLKVTWNSSSSNGIVGSALTRWFSSCPRAGGFHLVDIIFYWIRLDLLQNLQKSFCLSSVISLPKPHRLK